MDAEALARKLNQKIRGEVLFDDGTRALYAADASNYRQVPIGLVRPKTLEDVIETIAICRKFKAPILNRGAGTSLAGQCCNVAVVIDMSRHLNQILEIDPEKRTARVQPGVVLDDLRNLTKPSRLTFGPDPATHNRCTFGGMIGNNACGVHSIMAGKTVDNVEELEILTYDGLRMKVGRTSDAELEQIIREGGRRGEIYSGLKKLRDRYADLVRQRYPKIPRRVSGYNLDQLLPENGFNVARALVGTEGTCVTFLEATVNLVPDPPARSLVVLAYPDIYLAGADVAPILEFKPIGLEGLDEHFIHNMLKKNMYAAEVAMMPEGNGWLMVEFGGETQAEADQAARKMMESLRQRPDPPSMKLFSDTRDQKRIWAVRESTFGASVFVPGEKDTFAGFEDSAVPPAKLGDYMRDLEKLYEKYGYYAVTYGHFGDGCIHTRISFDLKTDAGIRKYRTFLDEASDLVIHYGGSLSGEHGDGQNWGEFLHKMFGPELIEAFRQFKAIWDPEKKMNPGKLIDTYRADENLRLKTYKTIQQPELHFKFPDEGGRFSRATERCIGLGKCLKKDEGIMCPSFMVTREEKHSTRGRAHLLHEMMRGEVVSGGWHDDDVKEALDLCLACKSCKTECPVNVDVATYKAEFLSHYYEGKMRPLTAFTFGMIFRWAETIQYMPWLANFFTRTPGLDLIAKMFAGVAVKRRIPAFAAESFRHWFRKRAVHNEDRPQVILWPDTFNNYFYPEVARAAVDVLEAAGFRVLIPKASFCCGRPLYDFGMLALAKQMLRQILDGLKPFIEQGIPVIGLEPGCVSVFRDEMPNLFPQDVLVAKFRNQIFLLAEFLDQKAGSFRFPKLNRKALVQGHCHHKSVLGMGADEKIMERAGLDFHILDAGCCGMAGAFGFEKKHYNISVEIGERVLLPAVRKADKQTLIIADGFSCREQIAELTPRRALHLAEVLQFGLKSDPATKVSAS